MEQETRLVWKVGLFVVIGLFATAVVVVAIRDWRILRAGYEIRVLFDSAGGLLRGAPVKFAGVDVGEVVNIRLVSEGSSSPLARVELSLWLPNGLMVRSDDRVLIGMLGLLGEKYVEILPGPGSGRILQAGDVLEGAGVVSELEFTQQFTHVLTQLEETLNAASALVNDPQIAQRIKSTLEQAGSLTKRLDETTQQAEALIRQWQRVGQKSSTAIDDLRQWAPWLVLGMALLIYLVTR